MGQGPQSVHLGAVGTAVGWLYRTDLLPDAKDTAPAQMGSGPGQRDSSFASAGPKSPFLLAGERGNASTCLPNHTHPPHRSLLPRMAAPSFSMHGFSSVLIHVVTHGCCETLHFSPLPHPTMKRTGRQHRLLSHSQTIPASKPANVGNHALLLLP